jgi:hypothetical protein
MTDSRNLTAMRRESIRAFFDASPTARLLRSELAPLVIDFLNLTFKLGDSIVVGQAELRLRLGLYQEDVHATQPQLLTGSPDRYLTHWVDAGWLQRFLESSSAEPQYQLTRHAEEAIRFVDSALSRGGNLVGTESRLRLVIETLENLVRGASDDPDRRVEYLRAQRAAIDEELAAIESGRSVRAYRPAQVRERFQAAVDMLKALQSDFRAVEERFQEIARDVQQLQATGSDSRGSILGYALDAEELLKTQDEGLSFFAFVAFLFSPAQQEALLANISELQRLPALADQHEALARVRKMVPALLAEAEKVMRTTARLSGTLRRLLDARSAAHRVRLASVLRDIRQAALRLGPAGVDRTQLQVTVETEPEIVLPLSRTFWSPVPAFSRPAMAETGAGGVDARRMAAAFARLQRLDFRQLRRTVRELTRDGRSRTLAQIVRSTAVRGGVVELLGYLQIAHDDGHAIEADVTETVTLPAVGPEATPLQVTLPRVTFVQKANLREVGRRPK